MPPSVAAAAAANHTFGLLLTELHKKIKSLRSVREDCYNLQRNLKIFAAYMYDEIQRDASTRIDRARGEEVRELVHDMEDCIERYMYRITHLDDAKWLPWIGGTAKTLPVRYRFAKKIKNLNRRVQQAGIDQIRRITAEASAPAGGGRDPTQEDTVGFEKAEKEVLTLLDEVENEPSKLRVIAIVGFGGSGKTTLASAVYRSLAPVADDANTKSKPTRFPLRAWVDRRHYKDELSLLKRLILQFWPEKGKTAAKSSDYKTLQLYLKNQVKNERYLIVLDDMDMDLWKWIDLTFKDKGISSRIIVTTSWLQTAFQCSSNSNQQRGDGYVYRMRTLRHEDSQTLARLNEIAHDSCPCHQQQCQCPLETLQKKCDGLPLALVSTAKYFNSIHRGRPTTGDCTTLCDDLGSYLVHKKPGSVPATAGVKSESFADLRGVLKSNYISLADGTLGACCLLYLGISPDARCLKRNKITWRWVAEGYGLSEDPRKSEQKQAEEIFNKLIDLNIIQPVGVCTSRTCKALGIVHEFVLHKSMSENFIMTIDSAKQSRASIFGNKKRKSRHLFVRGGNITSSRATVSTDLSHVRSLTVVTVTNEGSNNLGSARAGQEDVDGNISASAGLEDVEGNVSTSAEEEDDVEGNFSASARREDVEGNVTVGAGKGHGSGSACDGFFDFSKYRLLRVLDLEECTEVDNSHLASICNLWNLRYLSLGCKVNKLSNEIKLLKLLERLQLSKTKVTELPVEIIGMPSLKHLIGKFMLLGPEPSDELVENNKLETLSGIVADGEQGFLPLVPHLMNLRKVNICFDKCRRNMMGLEDILLFAIKGYTERRLEHRFSRSLSIDFMSLYGMDYKSFPQSAMEKLHAKLSSDNCYLTSLKLHYSRLLSPWPQFVALLSGLSKLSLSVDSVTNDLLSAISALQHVLVHLKLMAKEIPEKLVIQDGKFQSLQSLCFEVSGLNCSIPQIQVNGALPELRYFQLISKLLAPKLCGIKIWRKKLFPQLLEIELHAEVSPTTRQEWETAAMDHPNRPDVLPLRGVEAAAIALDSTASESGALEPYGPAENLTFVASPAGEQDTAVPVLTTTSNALGQVPAVNPVSGGAEAPAESPITIATEMNHQPTTQIPFASSSTPANVHESQYPADSVASPKHEVDTRLGLTAVENMASASNHGRGAERDKPSKKPVVVEEEALDTSISAQPVGESSNHARVNNPSNGVLAVHANGHGHDC